MPSTLTPPAYPQAQTEELPAPHRLERRGRLWLIWSFLFCPCHLPVSIGVLSVVLAGTSVGALLRDHAWVAGALVTVAWLAGTGYGFHLIRQAQRAKGACPVPNRRPQGSHP